MHTTFVARATLTNFKKRCNMENRNQNRINQNQNKAQGQNKDQQEQKPNKNQQNGENKRWTVLFRIFKESENSDSFFLFYRCFFWRNIV